MRPFRFRAHAALQLRQRQHDEALAALARAQADLARAVKRVEDAASAVKEADERFRAAMAGADAAVPLDWHRSWRMRLTSDRQRCEAECRAREADVSKATVHVASTRQRVRSLERLHDNALAAWKQGLAHEEQKTMDSLATLRFTNREVRRPDLSPSREVLRRIRRRPGEGGEIGR
jgi:flagellar export protein FliJ